MYHMTRRNVIATLTGTSAALLCPAILSAQDAFDPGWGEIPTTEPLGQANTIDVPEGPAEVDVTDLQPGEVTVIARPTTDEAYTSTGMVQYVAVHHRTPEQAASAQDADGAVQNPNYFVVDLLCPHRGKAVGITGNADVPFACTDRGTRHSSNFDATGKTISGASEDKSLKIPDYTLTVADTVVVQLA